MKTSAAGKREDLAGDLPAGSDDSFTDGFKLGGVDDDQWMGWPVLRIGVDATSQTAVRDVRVVRSIVLERPPEYLVEKLFRAHKLIDVSRWELDQVDVI